LWEFNALKGMQYFGQKFSTITILTAYAIPQGAITDLVVTLE